MRTHGRLRALLLVLFFLSGVAALAYEVAWLRVLSLAFGVSVYATSAVLTAFMGGMALGSRLAGRLAARAGGPDDGTASLLRLYAAVQAGVGIFAIASPWIFSRLSDLYVLLFREIHPGFYAYNLIRFGLATLALLVPTTLMGATLPLVSQIVARSRHRRGSDLGALYAANTFGGVLGTLLVAFILLRALGVQATIFLVAAVDLAVAGAALAASFLPLPAPEAAPRKERAPDREPAPAPARDRSIVLWGFAASGFAALGCEVIWTRILSMISLSTVYSFSIMLATFLVGLAAGSAIAGRLADRADDPVALFGYLQTGIGIGAAVVLFLFARLPQIVGTVVQPDTIPKQIAAEFFGASITMLAPTLMLGACFPIAARVYGGSEGAIGDRVGRLYALNTVGAMLGAFVTGFALIPLLGLQRSALALALLNLAVGAVALVRQAAAPRAVAAGGFALVGAFAFLLPPGVYLGGQYAWSPQLVLYREGVDATVTVFEQKGPPPMKVSYVNGRSEVPTDVYSMRAFYLLGHLPPLLHPQARSALMVSFGNGIASGAMSRHGIPRIQAVELVAGQVEAARKIYPRENRGILDRPGFSITIEDGRNYLLRGDERFDIITTDATHPINSSSWALFTREFYLLVKRRLATDGVFMQWLPFHSLSAPDYREIVATFASVFPNTSLWYTSGTHTFLVATPRPLTRADVAALEPRIDARGVGDDLADIRPLAKVFLMDSSAVAAYVSGARIVTDDTAYFMPSADELDAVISDLSKYGGIEP